MFTSSLQTVGIGFALSQIALILVLLLRSDKKQLAEWIFALLLFCVASDLLLQLSRAIIPFYINWILSFFHTAVPAIFWLFCYVIFDDHFQLRKRQIALVLAIPLLPLTASVLDTLFGTNPPAFEILLVDLPQLVELLLIVHGISIIARYWRTDLIPLRRQIGPSLIIFTGLLIGLVISTRYIVKIHATWVFELQYLLLALFLLYVNVHILKWQKLQLFGARSEFDNSSEGNNESFEREENHTEDNKSSTTTKTNEQVEQVEQLKHLMETKKTYQQTGLTINALAHQMGIPEYRLRSLINGELGYRNFNDFIGRYRIEEAAQQLSDPSLEQLPVQSIALGVGYRSLSSFNKSFKEIHSVTPTEFRRIRLND